MENQHVGNRRKKIAQMKLSLSKVPIISKNVTHIRAKLQSAQSSESTSMEGQTPTMDIREIKLTNMEIGLFEEKYELGRKIGEGANGLVRQCLHKRKQKKYAVKTMMMDEEHILFLKNNFLIVRGLKHPSIIQFKALYLDMKKHLSYLVMEYVAFPSLKDHLIKGEILEENDLKWVFSQLFKSLVYMHSKGIVHRDLKPENILVDFTHRRIKLIDFGSSRCLYRRKQKSDILTITGTLVYRAPEMFLGGGYSEKVDMWAVGVTLYELVVGKIPFDSEYHSETIHSIINDSPNINLDELQQYSWLLKDLILRLLKKKPQERLSAKDALNHLFFESSRARLGSENILPKSYEDRKGEQTEFSRMLVKSRDFDPNILNGDLSVKKINGADYHHIEFDDF